MRTAKRKPASAAPLVRRALRIMIAPRSTIQELTVSRGAATWMIPAPFMGIAYMLNQLSGQGAGLVLSIPKLLALALLGGSVLGLGLVYISGWILSWAGRALGGQGRSDQMRIVFGWSWLPSILALPVWIVLAVLLGGAAFSPYRFVWESVATKALVAPLAILQIIAGIWTLVILVLSTIEVHRFSWWRAMLALGMSAIASTVAMYPYFWALSASGLWPPR